MQNKKFFEQLIAKTNAAIKAECPDFNGQFTILADDDENLIENAYGLNTTFDPSKHFAIDYDFCDDAIFDPNCKHSTAKYEMLANRFHELCNEIYDYECIDSNDGSGNGLFYGIILMQK